MEVVGREALEQLAEREAAGVGRVRGTGAEPPRRGAVIASRTFRRMEAASVGTRKWPLVVPSPWSCRVSLRLRERGLLLVDELLVLVGVDHGPVLLHGLERSPGHPSELDRVEPLRLVDE